MLRSWWARAAVMISLVMIVATLFFVGFLTRPESDGPQVPNGPQPTSTTAASPSGLVLLCVVGGTEVTAPKAMLSECPAAR
jgi:hypothetical protein